MYNYKALIKNLFLIVFIVQIIKLYIEKNELRSTNHKLLVNQRKQSEKLVAEKEREVQSLRRQLATDEILIDESLSIVNELKNTKKEVETLYVERIQKINTLNANELKAYFDDELN